VVFIIISIQPLGLFGRNQSPVRRPVRLWHAAFLGKFLGVVCHCLPLPLDVPTFAARFLHVPINTSAPSSERWNCGWEWSGNFAEMTPFFSPFRDLLHATNLRHGKKGFTSLPKEGMLRNFYARKIRRLRLGVNPRSWVPEASMLTTRPPKLLNNLKYLTDKRISV
jgi:hypothetical protein